jgi:gas vesicle protein
MSAKNTFLAFLGGAIAGATVALLFAPEKGEVTRRKISKAVGDGRDFLADKYDEGRERITNAYHEGREKLADAISAGREPLDEELETICDATQKAKRTITSKR